MALALVSLWPASEAQAVRPRGTQARAHTGVAAHDFRGPRARDAEAMRALERMFGPVQVQFERADDRPARVALAGVEVAGANGDAARARRDARARLGALLAVLAPGETIDHFRLVSNRLDQWTGARDVAFVQEIDGLPVLGGQLSFRYANDRLVAIVNDTLAVGLPPGGPRQPATKLSFSRAAAEAVALSGLPDAHLEASSEPALAWFVADRRGKEPARRVHVVHIEGPRGVEAQRVLIDAETGEELLRIDTRLWGNASVRYSVPERYPAAGRQPYPLRDATVTVQGVDQETGPAGQLSFAGISAAFAHALTGPYTRVEDLSGANPPVTGTLNDGQNLVVSPGVDDRLDARMTTFVHANLVKDRLRIIAPGFDFVDEQLPSNVNLDDICNAFWDGESMNFFVAGQGCENTGRLPDVVYHEFGHAVHQNAIIPGVGFMNVAFSEGISDYLSATITNDAGVARGFFEDTDEPLRQLDPVGFEWTWPDDVGEVHDEGRIIGGAFWDLRTQLRQKYGTEEGTRLTDRLWFASVQRAYDIPSAYFEVLLADDDDANLQNGTPNVCEISEAFGAHGLFQVPGDDAQIDIELGAQRLRVEMPLEIPFAQCDLSASATFRWRDRDDPDSERSIVMAREGERFVAEADLPANGTVLQYAVDIDWSNGTRQHLPRNLADRWLELYVGPVVPLYCTGFEDGGNDGWTPFPPFEIGQPNAGPGAGDPEDAFEGEFIAGINLDGDGAYSPIVEQRLLSPPIDTGPFAEVRLQYWRDLDVEDGFFDQARILANGQPVWSNFASPTDITATVHHRDERWRFHDVDLSDAIDGPTDEPLQLEFQLLADGGLEFGGWHLDALCVVGVEGPACGDGRVDAGEQCDDGNRNDGDGCDADCMAEPDPPDPTTSTSGQGETTSGTEGGDFDGITPRGCACDAEGRDDGPAPLSLACLLGLGWWLRRRQAPSVAAA